LRRPPPRYVTPKAGFEPALPGSEVSDIFTTSASLQPHRDAANINSAAALIDAPPIANSEEFALPSVSGSSPRSLRQAPRAWARALPREPRDPGLPFRLAPGIHNCAPGNKKPSGAAGSGGSVSADCPISPRQDRSQEPGMRDRSAPRRSTGLLVFRVRKSLSDPYGFTSPLLSARSSRKPAPHFSGSCVFVRARDIRPEVGVVNRRFCEFFRSSALIRGSVLFVTLGQH